MFSVDTAFTMVRIKHAEIRKAGHLQIILDCSYFLFDATNEPVLSLINLVKKVASLIYYINVYIWSMTSRLIDLIKKKKKGI